MLKAAIPVVLLVMFVGSVIALNRPLCQITSCDGIGCDDKNSDAVLVGRVLTDTHLHSYVSIYRLNSAEFYHVMQDIQNKSPFARALILQDRYFIFRNVRPGIYALAMNREQMLDGWGPPVPLFVDGKSYRLRIIWHGGDINWGVSVFSIELCI